jgi:hypothetical protein
MFREESTQKEIQIDGLGFSMILLGFATASIVHITNKDQMSKFLLMICRDSIKGRIACGELVVHHVYIIFYQKFVLSMCCDS